MRRYFLLVSGYYLLLLHVLTVQVGFAQVSKESKGAYQLMLRSAGKDTTFNWQALRIKTTFSSRKETLAYVDTLPGLLSQSGYLAASVDSVWEEPGVINILIYRGPLIRWGELETGSIDGNAMESTGFNPLFLKGKPVDMQYISLVQEKLLRYYQDHGFPFAGVSLDSVEIIGELMNARLNADKSLLYHVDSIRLLGKARISRIFLSHYLGIYPHSVYCRDKLEQIDRRLSELPFLKALQPSDLQMLGSGSVLNLYLHPQKSSRVNMLLGILPGDANGKKMQIAGDLLLDLKNTFGRGESLLVNWQQLQPRSPRLNLGYNQPYVFNTPVGFDFLFDLFRKDSNFLQINTLAGIEYAAGTLHKGKIFLQWQDNKLLEGGIDTSFVKLRKQLPPNIDLRAANLGMQYEYQGTNFRLNPRNGTECGLNVSAGIKKINPNSQITGLVDPAYKYASLYDSLRLRTYLLRLRGWASVYVPLSRFSVLKLSFQGGWFQSPDIFRNELFQIGGFRLLRGFDEESIYSTRYSVLTFEYRYLLGDRSYLYGFSDAAISQNRHQEVRITNRFISAGLGMNFQTRQGMLSVCYAAGYRDDVPFRLSRASKLHFGYYYYF